MTNSRQLSFLDAAGLIAIVRVVYLHGLNNYQIVVPAEHPTPGLPSWQIITALLVRHSIPLFVLAAGFKFALAYQRRPNIPPLTYVAGRTRRLLKPYLVWTLLVYVTAPWIYPSFLSMPGYEGFPIPTTAALFAILSGASNPAYPLWFIPMLYLTSIVYLPIHHRLPGWLTLPILFIVFISIRMRGVTIPWSYPAYWVFYDLGVRLADHSKHRSFFPAIMPIGAGISIVLYGLSAGYLFIYRHIGPVFPATVLTELSAPLAIFFVCGTLWQDQSNPRFHHLAQWIWPVFILHEPFILGQIAWTTYIRLDIRSPFAYLIVCLLTLITTILIARLLRSIRLDQILF
ncbi:acyltransferase family protein [bacterium]|nr:acyltransferase family protein [candidate division CSSED10-310 bacterium]